MPSNLKVKATRRTTAVKTYFVKSARANASLILQPPENSLQERAVVLTWLWQHSVIHRHHLLQTASLQVGSWSSEKLGWGDRGMEREYFTMKTPF